MRRRHAAEGQRPPNSQVPAGDVDVHIPSNRICQIVVGCAPSASRGAHKAGKVDPAADSVLASTAGVHSGPWHGTIQDRRGCTLFGSNESHSGQHPGPGMMFRCAPRTQLRCDSGRRKAAGPLLAACSTAWRAHLGSLTWGLAPRPSLLCSCSE
jgi:hypothetical protein